MRKFIEDILDDPWAAAGDLLAVILAFGCCLLLYILAVCACG